MKNQNIDQQLKDLLQVMPNAFIFFKVESDRLIPLIFSQEFCRLVGGTEADCRAIASSDGMNGVHPDDLLMVREFFAAHCYTPEPQTLVYRIRAIAGHYIWTKVTFLFTELQEQTYLYISYTDINELKLQEELLSKQYEHERAFIDSVAETYLFSARANITADLIEDMWGKDIFHACPEAVSYAENVESMLRHLVNQRQKEVYKKLFSREALLQAFDAGKNVVSMECCYVSDNGSIHWTDCQAKLFRRAESGDIIAFIVELDKTKLKIAESIMQQIIMTQYDYVMCIRGKEKKTNIISINQDTIDSEDIHDTDDYDDSVRIYAEKYVVPEERDAFISFMDLDNVWKIMETQDFCSQAFRFIIDGKLHYKRLEFYCLDREGGLLANVRNDFTNWQLTQMDQEKKLREALELAQAAGIAKDDFLSRMSHDIRTPLNGIIGMTNLAKVANQSDEVGNYLEKISISSRFLLGLVNDILDMSKIAAGKMELRLEPYREEDFVKYISSVISPLCDAKEIHFVLPTEPMFENCTVLMDKLKYNQIFFNIFSNAVKFTPTGGTVTLAVENVIMGDDKVEADFIISDTGIGMSREFQQHLFQPFEQENTSRNSNRNGTGLGLAIAKRLIELMSGTVRVDSELGKGSIFTMHFAFPRVPDKVDEDTVQKETVSLVGRHILVVEDNDINAEILETILRQKGASTVLAKNGVEAVEAFGKSVNEEYDVILMDVRMPVMDGLEATRCIRAMERDDAVTVPIIAITANAYADDVKECLVAGMNTHVAKPVDPDDLFAVLQKYLV